MIRAVATVGYLGNLPYLGGLFSAALSLAAALALFLTTQNGIWLMGAWGVIFFAAAWALPKAMESAEVPDRTIVIDKVLGAWLMAGPVVPAVLAAQQINPALLPFVILAPLVIFQLLLIGPLRRMGKSTKPWFRIGDDLIAGGLVMVISLIVLGALIALPGQPPSL